jgi:hypothetical protein
MSPKLLDLELLQFSIHQSLSELWKATAQDEIRKQASDDPKLGGNFDLTRHPLR